MPMPRVLAAALISHLVDSRASRLHDPTKLKSEIVKIMDDEPAKNRAAFVSNTAKMFKLVK